MITSSLVLAILPVSLVLIVAVPTATAAASTKPVIAGSKRSDSPVARTSWQRNYPVVSKRRAIRIAMRHTRARCFFEAVVTGWACPTDGPGWGLEGFTRLATANTAIVNTFFILMPPPDARFNYYYHYSCRMTVWRSIQRNSRGEYSGAYHHTRLTCGRSKYSLH